jgi:hypothetical protein
MGSLIWRYLGRIMGGLALFGCVAQDLNRPIGALATVQRIGTVIEFVPGATAVAFGGDATPLSTVSR